LVIRVLHEGQYEIADEPLQRMNDIDEQMFQAVVAGDAGAFRVLLERALSVVRSEGRVLAVDDLRPSDLVLPAPDSTMDEVRSLFVQEGLIKIA
jgi:hypothetical protein